MANTQEGNQPAADPQAENVDPKEAMEKLAATRIQTVDDEVKNASIVQNRLNEFSANLAELDTIKPNSTAAEDRDRALEAYHAAVAHLKGIDNEFAQVKKVYSDTTEAPTEERAERVADANKRLQAAKTRIADANARLADAVVAHVNATTTVPAGEDAPEPMTKNQIRQLAEMVVGIELAPAKDRQAEVSRTKKVLMARGRDVAATWLAAVDWPTAKELVEGLVRKSASELAVAHKRMAATFDKAKEAERQAEKAKEELEEKRSELEQAIADAEAKKAAIEAKFEPILAKHQEELEPVEDEIHNAKEELAALEMKAKGKKPRTTKPKGPAIIAGKNSGARGRTSVYAGKTIRAKVTENPRKEGTHGHRSFQVILDHGPVSYEDFIRHGGRSNDLKVDEQRGRVETY